jgi:hypothetical protein
VSGHCVPNIGTGGTGGSGNTGGGAVCGELEVSTERIIPNIMIIVDRSGSMAWDFAGNEEGVDAGFNPNEVRWEAVEEALVSNESGSEGIVRRLDSIARFGLTLYWKPSGPTSPDGSMCAATNEVAFSQNPGTTTNAIGTTFSNNAPGGYTPTAEAVASVTASLRALPPPEGPTVYLLATDGEPNGCNERGGSGDRANSVNAVTDAFSDPDLRIRTFVLGVSFNDTHLQDLADAGGGEYFFVDSVAGLQSTLEDIVVQNIPCTVSLTDGTIDTARACEGKVWLDDELLTCNGQDGWQAVDGNTIELMGDACDDWRLGGADLLAKFPCDVVVLVE